MDYKNISSNGQYSTFLFSFKVVNFQIFKILWNGCKSIIKTIVKSQNISGNIVLKLSKGIFKNNFQKILNTYIRRQYMYVRNNE